MSRLTAVVGILVLLTVFYGTVYTVVQQVQRHDANDPQIQLAEDTASALNQGTPPATLVSGHVDPSSSLDPFVIIYDKAGQAVVGSGYLHNQVPIIPTGALTAANGQTYHAVTWQPAATVRIAAVIISTDKYYVLAGRSLQEVERNETASFQLSTFGWLLSIIIVASLFLVAGRLKPMVT